MRSHLSLLQALEVYQNNQETVAVAYIVRREAPTSGKPGDKALVTQRGEIKGWIGGGCTQGIVIKEAIEAINEGMPRLVRIQTALDAPQQMGVKNYKMTCMSGGSVEVYIEPIMPVAELRIFGRSHIAKSLCEIGEAAGFRVTVISDIIENEMFPKATKCLTLKALPSQEFPNDFVVVCTQGEDDEGSLAAAIHTNPRYLGFVASTRKANSILMALKRQGMAHEQLARVKTPAGLDIQAKTSEEVAISILAEIIQVKRKTEVGAEDKGLLAGLPKKEMMEDLYINPVCKIPVSKSGAKHVLEYQNEKVYFCCDGCLASFEKDPAAYL
jgi:xanthine dehydrogenase accessory factor